MDSSRRNLALWTIACFVVGAIGIAVAFSGGAPISDGVPLVAPDGMTVVIEGSTNADFESFTPTSGTVELTTTAGNATFFASGNANATVHKDEIVGPWTNVTHIDASTNAITVNPADKPSFVVGNQIDNVSVRDSFALDDGVIDFVYGGASGQSRVTIQGVPANTDMVAVDASSGAYLDTATSTGSGAVTFDALTNSKHSVQLQSGGTDAPVLSNPSPTGPQSSAPTTFSIDVNDSEFPNGDSVEVNISTGSFVEYNPVDSLAGGTTCCDYSMVGDEPIMNSEVRITPSFSGDIEKLEAGIATSSFENDDNPIVVDIYIVNEQPDGTTGEGTLVVDSWQAPTTAGNVEIPLDNAYTVSQNSDYSVEFVVVTENNDGDLDLLRIRGANANYQNGLVTSGATSVTVDRPMDLSVFSTQGTQVSSTTITSNQTVTASVPSAGQTGGQHNWTVTASDSFGAVTSQDYTYKVPSELQFREESPAHPLIQDPVNPITVEATFYEDDEDNPVIINRTTTDGTMSLEGLPVSSDFSLSVNVAGYHNRTVKLDNIYEQTDIFLINKTQTTVQNRFVVSDRTGNFPNEETSLLIQAAVNQSLYSSSGFEWKTVAGDFLGADEAFTTDLIAEKRYRIVAENEDGDTRILGAYTPVSDGIVELTIGNVQLDPAAPGGQSFNATWSNSTGTPEVSVGYNDTTRNTSQLYLHIYERNNPSNELVANQSFVGSYGTFTYQAQVPPGDEDTTWVVKLTAVQPNNENGVYMRQVGPGSPVLQDMPAYLVTIIFVGTILTVAGLMSQINGGVGGLLIAGLGGMFYFMNLVPAYLGGGVVVLSMLVGAMLFIRDQRGAGL